MKFLLKKLKTYFRKHKANKIKSSSKIIVSAGLALSLRFGEPRLTSSRLSSLNYESQVVTERVILNQKQESNSCDDSHNSNKVVQIRNGRILKFQQDVFDASSNEILSDYNLNEIDKADKIILVQADGILPGADGFLPIYNYPRRRHPFGRPRMRGTGVNVNPPRNIQELGNIPRVRSFREVDTDLNARRSNRGDQCLAPEFDMKEEYGNFIQKISKKGYELECTQERFNELSTNPQTGSFDEKSLIEAKGGLQGEAQGMYTNIRRPSNKAVDLDFEIDSSKGYTHVDYKTPIDFQDLADKKGIDVSNFPSLETVAYNMGKKITPQKEQFCGLLDGPKSPENVLHVVNLDLIRDSNQKQNMIDSVLKGAEDKGDNTVGIYFLNYL